MEAKTTVPEGPSLPSPEEQRQEKGLSNNAQEDDFSNKVGGGDAADGDGDAAYVAAQASVAESLAAEREGWGEGDERFDLEAIWTAAREEERKQELKAAEKLRGKLQEQRENDFSDDLSEQDELPSDFSL